LNKTAALPLILVMVALCAIGFLPVMAQNNIKTFAFLYVEPNRVTPEQKAAITMVIEPPPPETVGCYSGLQIAITHPDGSVETIGPFSTNEQGVANTFYASSYLGTYTLQLMYPGETFANGTITYQSSSSIATGIAVQSASNMPSALPSSQPTAGAAPNENTWTKRASMHEARGGLGAAVVNRKIYAIGGSSQSGLYPANIQGGFVGTNEEYDPVTNTWTYKSPMPTPRSDFAIAVYNNKIYCLGGTVGTEKVDVIFSRFVTSAVNEVYDPATDTWETKASLPNAGMFMQAFVVGNRIYVIDGPFNEVYDPENDSWITKAPTPLPAEDYGADGSNDYALFLLNNKLYVAGQFSTRLINYDTSQDAWSTGTTLPDYDFYSVAGAMTTGSNAPKRLYVFLGLRGWVPSAVTIAYDPVTNLWIAGKSIPTNRVHPGVVVVDDKLYVVGGYAMSVSGRVNASALNEQYTPIGYGIPGTVDMNDSSSSTTSSASQPTDPEKTIGEEPTSQSPEPTIPPNSEEPEPFSPNLIAIVIVATIVVAIASVGLLAHFAKHHAKSGGKI
jgi:N-acetylneuraminic acid mutarotase